MFIQKVSMGKYWYQIKLMISTYKIISRSIILQSLESNLVSVCYAPKESDFVVILKVVLSKSSAGCLKVSQSISLNTGCFKTQGLNQNIKNKVQYLSGSRAGHRTRDETWKHQQSTFTPTMTQQGTKGGSREHLGGRHRKQNWTQRTQRAGHSKIKQEVETQTRT